MKTVEQQLPHPALKFVSLLDLRQPPSTETDLKRFLCQRSPEFAALRCRRRHSYAQRILVDLAEKGFAVQRRKQLQTPDLNAQDPSPPNDPRPSRSAFGPFGSLATIAELSTPRADDPFLQSHEPSLLGRESLHLPIGGQQTGAVILSDSSFVNFDDKDIPPEDKDMANALIDRFRFHAGETWLVDVEFYTLSHRKEFVPMKIAITTIDDRRIIHSPINYGLSSDELWDQLKGYANPEGASPKSIETRRRQFYSMFEKHYDQDHTHGLTFAEIKSKLLENGWTPSHVLLSYYATHDLSIFIKIMNGDASVITTAEPAQHLIDVYHLVKALNPKLRGYTLQNVYDHYYSGLQTRKITFHCPGWDVAVLQQIIVALICVDLR